MNMLQQKRLSKKLREMVVVKDAKFAMRIIASHVTMDTQESITNAKRRVSHFQIPDPICF